MKKFSSIILFLLFFVPVTNAQGSQSSLENITKQIPQMGSIKCKFRQEKYLPSISKPLISSGNFEFVQNKGVYFHTLYPVQSTVDYTNKNYKPINDIINAISTKRYEKLEKEFSFYFAGNSSKWSLEMKPKEKSNAYNYISSIKIEGADYIHKINIQQKNGNRTVLCFTK